ncbi:MAG: hypothetical protein PHH14_03260 [Candidatus Margulisbacteria bacterium]|nr:hypothetical protein [Candidatus Margulisiibacteriota bacterium]
MKKIVVGFMLIGALALAASAGMLQDKSVLSEPVPQGKLAFDADVAYSTASDILFMPTLSTTVEASWRSLSAAGISSVTYLNVPLRVSYGFADNFSLRLTIPYASFDMKTAAGTETKGSGLANVEVEGLYQFFGDKDNSFAMLLKYKNGTGKKMSELGTGEAYVGSRSSDLLFAGIGSKAIGPVKGKLLLGYLYTGPYSENLGLGTADIDIKISNQLIYSLALLYSASDQLEFSGEFNGAMSLDKEKWSYTSAGVTNSVEFDHSLRDYLTFSPAIAYKFGEQLVVRGSADLLLSKTAAVTLNIWDMYKYNTYKVGLTYTI